MSKHPSSYFTSIICLVNGWQTLLSVIFSILVLFKGDMDLDKSIVVSANQETSFEVNVWPTFDSRLKHLNMLLHSAQGPISYSININRSSLGAIEPFYSWDYKSQYFQTSDYSLVDLEKEVHETANVEKWEVVLSHPTKLRLKIWHLTNNNWRAIWQSTLYSGSVGKNLFEEKQYPKVYPGDRLGLYVQSPALALLSPQKIPNLFPNSLDNQDAGNMREAALLRKQIGFLDDVDIGNVLKYAPTFKPGEYAWKVQFKYQNTTPALDGTISRTIIDAFQEKISLDFRTLDVSPNESIRVSIKNTSQNNLRIKKLSEVRISEYNGNLSPFSLIILIFLLIAIWICHTNINSPNTAISVLPIFFLSISASLMMHFPIHSDSQFINLLPALIYFSYLPGFLIIKVMSATNIHLLLKAQFKVPWIIVISTSVWSMLSIPAYLYSMSLIDLLICQDYLVAFLLLGYFYLIQRHEQILPLLNGRNENYKGTPFSTNFLKVILFLVVFFFAIVGAKCMNFQRTDIDTWGHVAAIRNIVESGVIRNYDHILGIKDTIYRTYVCNPLYVLLSLITKFSGNDASLVMVYLSIPFVCVALFTAVEFLRLFLDEKLTLISGIIGVTYLVLHSVLDWRVLWYFPFAQSFYPYHFAQLICFPLAIIAFVRFRENCSRNYGYLLSMIFIPVVLMHPVYFLYSPLVFILPLVLSIVFKRRPNYLPHLIRQVGILLGIYIIALIFRIWANKFGSTEITDLTPLLTEIGRGSFYVNNHLFSNNPFTYVIDFYWLPFGSLMIFMYVFASKTESRAAVSYLSTQLGPWLVVFNPFLVPQLVRLFRSGVPIHRGLDLGYSILGILPFGGCVAIFSFLLAKIPLNLNLRKSIFVGTMVLSAIAPLSFIRIREAFIGSVNNWGWYTSILHNFDDPIIAVLRGQSPSRIAVPQYLSFYIAGMTSHDPIVAPNPSYTADHQRYDERIRDSDLIINFKGSLQEVETALKKWGCKLIMVHSASDAIAKYDMYPLYFQRIGENGAYQLYKFNHS